MADDLIVRINIVGHASRRWRGAKSAAEAEKLNQQLSEVRAKNLRNLVEPIVKKELPDIPIEVPARGVGSRQGFPVVSEDNAAVDRSVVVSIDLSHIRTGSKDEQRPAKIYAPSKFWKLIVLSKAGGSGIGVKGTFLRIAIQNLITGRQLKMSGYLFGGAYDPKLFEFDGSDREENPKDFDKPVGNEVIFQTEESEGFDYWVGSEKGQWVRLVHGKVGFIRKRETTFLQFTRLDSYSPGSLVFEYESGWSEPSVNLSVVSGKLDLDGPIPSDFVDGTKTVSVPTIDVHNMYDGLLLSFPTGKSGVSDLTSGDRKRLTDFVTNRSRAIRALGFPVTNPRP